MERQTISERLVVTTRELASMCSLCERTIVNLIRAGKIPARKIGRRTLILRTDAMQWLADAPRVPTKEGGN